MGCGGDEDDMGILGFEERRMRINISEVGSGGS